MEVGFIGLGKMGSGMVRRLMAAQHRVYAYDTNEAITMVGSVQEVVDSLPAPRVVWLMIPAGKPVDETIKQLASLLQAGDLIVDGGNCRYTDSIRHADQLREKDIHFIDMGVSGGVAGEKTGYALMAGGTAQDIKTITPLIDTLAQPHGFLHVGAIGAGHFVKMIHNAIEYGMMQAIGEGLALLKDGPFSDLDTAAIAKLWNNGTIIRSYLMELTAQALARDSDLVAVAPYVEDSGEGRWAVETAVEHGIPFPVNTAALYARFSSQQHGLFSAKVLAALRKEFGGHPTKPA